MVSHFHIHLFVLHKPSWAALPGAIHLWCSAGTNRQMKRHGPGAGRQKAALKVVKRAITWHKGKIMVHLQLFQVRQLQGQKTWVSQTLATANEYKQI